MALQDRFLIRAPIDDVFACLADARWMKDYLDARRITITLETGDPVGPGARFRYERGVRGPWFYELTRYEPPTHITGEVRWSERRGTARTTYDLEATKDGTVVLMRGSGLSGVVGSFAWAILLWPPFRSKVKSGNRQMAALIEQHLATT